FSGEIFIDGEKFDLSSPSDAIRAKIGFVTEDRKRFGLILDQSVMDNLTLVALKKISGRHIRHVAREASTVKKPIESLRIKASTPLVAAGNLSGGNQQKVVLGKWLLSEPKVLFLDEPTRGIDVGAKQEIYAEIDRLASEGMAIVMVSSELPEVLGLSDRILVLCEGRPAATFTREQATAETVMAAATGSN
ncbi:MAG TPA: ATP-binding cassette domain-containing protein, partial [Pyrinomonadaceae bacterium]|nr:ATP-binding cassette domain-containing protein [Pyrinomonadaceae bacterium]